MTDPTQELVARLASRLEPVRRLPRLRAVGETIALLSLAIAVGATALRARSGVPPLLEMTPLRAAITIALLTVFAGGLAYGLASSVPGRETLARSARAVVIGGMSLGLMSVVGMLLAGRSVGPLDLAWVRPAFVCLSSGSFFALVPAVGIMAFVLGAASFRPPISMAIGVGGTVGLGAALVHVNCAGHDVLHVLVSHVGAPLLLGALVWLAALAAGYFLRRRQAPDQT